jgi:aspartate aminotransferase-like enzyme
METNLRIPGPTPVPPQVLRAMCRPMINHRGPEFKALLEELLAGLGPVFGTAGDVLIFPASSTGGMEAAIVNTLSPGDRVLAVSIGYFGDRFARIAADFGADVTPLAVPWGQAVSPAAVAQRLEADPTIRAVLVTHNETSTGATNDVEAIARVVTRSPALLIVDAVSSLAALPLPMDAWGVDVVVAGSQKALMVPPGLALVAVGPRAWQAHRTARLPRHYWDFTAAATSQRKGQNPYTPALSLYYALAEALKMIRAEGLEAVYARHRRLGAFMRDGVRALGLELFADPASASDTVTSIRVPPGVDGKQVLRALREEHGVVMAGGQGPLDGKILRVGHLGWVHESDLAATLKALDAVLHQMGFAAGRGGSSAAASK